MTGLGVERVVRVTYPAPSVSPIGVSSPLPPHIQGAERPTENRARHTGSRWSLRVLVVGGLAGAAWLLTGAAAHAADRDSDPTGSLLGSVMDIVDSDATMPATGLLKAAAQPLEAERPAHHQHHIVADVLELPQRALSRSMKKLDAVAYVPGTSVDAVFDDAYRVPRDVADSPRPTGGPASTKQRLDSGAGTVTEEPRPAAERPHEPAVTPVPAAPHTAPVAVVSHQQLKKALRAPAVVRIRHARAASSPSAHRPAVAHAAIPDPETASGDTPGGDGPAVPMRLHLGDVSGAPTSTSGSGTPTEGGCAAFLPAAIVSSSMACHQLPIAHDIEVRRFDAEAPTVSPD